MTIATVRRRIRALLTRERALWAAHKKDVGVGKCLSGCEDRMRAGVATELLLDALEATGARVTRKDLE